MNIQKSEELSPRRYAADMRHLPTRSRAFDLRQVPEAWMQELCDTRLVHHLPWTSVPTAPLARWNRGGKR